MNHNTSAFSELCLRSLVATHPPGQGELQLHVTVADNHSTDDGVDNLRTAALELGAEFELTPWPASTTPLNSHGDVLRRFVLREQEASYFLFLDCDIVFTSLGTVGRMCADLAMRPRWWALQAAFHWVEEHRGIGASLDIGKGSFQEVAEVRDPSGELIARNLSGLGKGRAHPGCTLVKPLPAVLATANEIGFGCAFSLSTDPRLAGYYDTLSLATHVLATHGLGYGLSREKVIHYFNVSYESGSLTESKLADCQRRLAILRADPTAIPEPGSGAVAGWGDTR